MNAVRDAGKLTFSVDLINAARHQLYFLEDIERKGIFYDGAFLDKAIFRYERYWLRLCAHLNDSGVDSNKYYPPLDVAWVWHCHMLSPTDYIRDCQNLLGRIINHKYPTQEERISKQNETKRLWEENFHTSFDYFSKDSIDKHDFDSFQSKIQYDIKAASGRQKSFYYQVSLPHFTDDRFIIGALERYKKFLFLKKLNPTAFVVPCYAIDLIWHTHQLHPLAYASDTKSIIGFVLPHDDSVNDRTPGSKLNLSDKITRDLWQKTYNQDFFCPGAMFRGDPPSKKMFSNENVEFSFFYVKSGQFNLSKIEMLPKNKDNRSNNSNFKIIIRRNNYLYHKLYEAVLSANEIKGFNEYFSYSELDPTSLHTDILVQYNESAMEKFGNVFKLGHRHNKKLDLRIDNRLVIPSNEIEVQKFSYSLKDSKNNEFKLNMDWKVSRKLEPKIVLNLMSKNFEQIDMNNCIKEYKAFDLKNRDFSGNKGLSIRAKHMIVASMGNQQPCYLYSIEMTHVMSIRWSAIKILLGTKLMATSHLIGLTQLPTHEQVTRGFHLNTKYEKAMLVRNVYGDFAIVKGKWEGLRKGVPPTTRYGRGVPGSPGHLDATIFFCNTKEIVKLTIDKDFKFDLSYSGLDFKLDLKTGKIDIEFKREIQSLSVESMLALIMSISVLHVFLQPKPRNPPLIKSSNNQANSISTKPIYRGGRPIQTIYTNDYVFFYSVGYFPLIDCWSMYCSHQHCHNNSHEHCHNIDEHNNPNENNSNSFETIDGNQTETENWLTTEVEGNVDIGDGGTDSGNIDVSGCGGCGGCGGGDGGGCGGDGGGGDGGGGCGGGGCGGGGGDGGGGCGGGGGDGGGGDGGGGCGGGGCGGGGCGG